MHALQTEADLEIRVDTGVDHVRKVAFDVRRGLNRLFAVFVACWALYCVFGIPFQAGREIDRHFERDRKDCYESFSSPPETLRDCLAMSEDERRRGMYSGLGDEIDEGGTLYGSYWRHDRWIILGLILVPPILLYGSIWGVTVLCR